MIKLSKRLEAISSLVPVNAKVIDVGCDHALLDIYLYQNKISKKIIATDVNLNALGNAQENIKKVKLDKYIETRLGNGIDPLNSDDDIDTIIMAGMGAHTIIGILKNNYQKLKNIDNIIIQSNTKLFFLRKEMMKLNYKIDNEVMVLDNKKIYTIIKYVKGKQKYNKKELYFGPVLLKNNSKLFQEYNKKELAKLEMKLKLLPKDKIMMRYKTKREIELYKKIV